jgi:zinc/manganese transport system permease protein
MRALLSLIFEPAFFTSEPVHTAMVVGGGAALVSGVIGVFTVMRGQSFAGHALADVSSAGGAASFLLGINPLSGFLIMAILGAGGMELVRVHRAGERAAASHSLIPRGRIQAVSGRSERFFSRTGFA